jgi:hypothetical protein
MFAQLVGLNGNHVNAHQELLWLFMQIKPELANLTLAHLDQSE